MTSKSVDALLDQTKNLMINSTRFQVRAQHLRQLAGRRLFAPWATTTQPYPPFIQSNTRLLTKIREVRQDATRRIQELAEEEFRRQSEKLQKEGDVLINTLESITMGKQTPTLDERLNHVASLVGRAKATLEAQLDERTDTLARRQPTPGDWDDFFHYCGAYKRNRPQQKDAFQVTPTDRTQADRETEEEVRAIVAQDLEEGELPPPPPPNPKRKRQPSPLRSQRNDEYRIPNKHQQSKRTDQGGRRMDQPHHPSNSDRGRRPNNEQDRDFGRTRPRQENTGVYYNSHYRRRDNSRGRSHPDHRNQRDPEREKKLEDLQLELDRLRRM